MNQEIELKLGLQPNQLGRFNRHGLWRSLAEGRARTQHLITTYFDTAELALRRQGAALRVRQSKGNRPLQTLKVPAPENGPRTAKTYHEYEAELDGNNPDLSRIEGAEAETLVAGSGLAAELKPVFTTDFTRRVLPVRLADAEIEVALDVGEVRSGKQVIPICEAELELKSGHPGRLAELALALHESLPVRLEQRTKAARGYGLLTGNLPLPVKARRFRLERSASVAEAIPVVIRECLFQVFANEPAVLHGHDPEGIHQMRVGLRRLRAFLALVRPFVAPDVAAYMRVELGWLQRELGPARDWDVFISDTLERLSARQGATNGLGPALRYANEARGAAYERARAAVTDPRFTAILLRTEIWLDSGQWIRPGKSVKKALSRPARRFAKDALKVRERKLHKLGRRHDTLSEADLHRLRIRAKNLRYVTEFFQSLFRKKRAAAYIDSLRELQDVLGTLNDAVVNRVLLEELGQRGAENKRAQKAIAHADALVRGWTFGRIESDLARLSSVWARHSDRRHFWT